MASVGAQCGDLIEFFRHSNVPPYQHWAVYVGNGYVVHLAAPSEGPGAGVSSSKSITADRAIVKKELLSVVAGTDKYRVNNKHDDKYRPLPPNKVVQRAERLVGVEIPYSMDSQNCEHFVNVLRYGVSRSDQVTNAFTVVGVSSLCWGIIAFVGLLLAKRDL